MAASGRRYRGSARGAGRLLLGASMMDLSTILAERRPQHGPFDRQAELAQRLKFAMQTGDNWKRLPAPQREALEMVQHKISRILTGDPNLVDHWHDIAGYATLVAKLLSDVA
jgi:hypothetical protein